MSEYVVLTLPKATVEHALNALDGAAEDRREPERYREWFREASQTIHAELLSAAAPPKRTVNWAAVLAYLAMLLSMLTFIWVVGIAFTVGDLRELCRGT